MIFYHEARGFNSNWRADELSRSEDLDDCRLPEANDESFWVRINFNADPSTLRMNASGMILEQVLRLE